MKTKSISRIAFLAGLTLMAYACENSWNCLRSGGTLIIRGYYSDPDNTKSLFGALFDQKP